MSEFNEFFKKTIIDILGEDNVDQSKLDEVENILNEKIQYFASGGVVTPLPIEYLVGERCEGYIVKKCLPFILKPCPFCGCYPEYKEESTPEGMYGIIKCVESSCIMFDIFDFQENIGGGGGGKYKLFSQWNKRISSRGDTP